MKTLSLPLVNESTEPPRFWQSLDELNAREVHQVIEQEFPDHAGFLTDEVSRRKFLTLMGASLALAGVGGCGRTAPDKIVPRVRQPENTIPGKPKYYATAMPMPGGATGILVESHEGRPTKIEGNPDHPASLGATGIFEQAAILGLYDPDRAKTIKHNGQTIGWDDALLKLRKELGPIIAKQGEGLALLTGSINSPTLSSQVRDFLRLLPNAKWYSDEPVLRGGHEIVPADSEYLVQNAEVLVAIDSDFLATGPNHVRYARDFFKNRDPDRRMARLYSVESMPTSTGFAADHRFAMSTVEIANFVAQLAVRLTQFRGSERKPDRLADALANDLQRHKGKALLIPGRHLTQHLRHLIGKINQSIGEGLAKYLRMHLVDDLFGSNLRALTKSIQQKEVKALITMSVNPVYDASADLEFTNRLPEVDTKICLSLYDDETAAQCQWHIPQSHFLETWSDTVAPDGTASIIQPLIMPLYQTKSQMEFLGDLSDVIRGPSRGSQTSSVTRPTRDLDRVRDYWRKEHQQARRPESFEEFWRKSIHSGVLPELADKNDSPAVNGQWEFELRQQLDAKPSHYELILRPDPTIFDGRFANNAWLQELPKPITKLVWENAAIMSPNTAKELGIEMHEGPHGGSHGELITELVELTYRGRTVTAPAYVLPGHADKAVTLHFGYGRTRAGRVGNNLGVNAYALQTSDAPWGGPGLEVKRTGKSYTLACTQSAHSLNSRDMQGRDIVRLATAAEFAKDPSVQPKTGHHAHGGEHNPHVEGFDHPAEFYTNPQVGPPYQWGMSVDLGKCTGCHSCVIACQAENSIPVVGKDLVTRGREMHWLRIDRYFTGNENNPLAVHQPMMCQHCENAPCEVVCPVEATTHSPDGLNEMTYNRCVGTRYCANNCPYKVRRFNFLQYTDYATESLKLQRNPDVSVRVRGVMEKCTFCVQRIREAEINAKVERRSIRDGDIVTACQQACPTEAIIFGNIIDQNSRVSQLKKLPRDYGVLTELNTKPRTTYLAAVRNPNPELS